MKRLGLACLLVFAMLSVAGISYAQVTRLEFTEVESVQYLSDGLLIRINGEERMIPRPQQESVLIVLNMKGGGERIVGFNIRGEQLNQPVPTPQPNQGYIRRELPTQLALTPQPPDQNYKHRIDITGQDVSSVRQKLQEFNLSNQEQEIIMNWLRDKKLDRYTVFTIGYNETGDLILRLIGPSSQANGIYKKGILQDDALGEIWKPQKMVPEIAPETVQLDPNFIMKPPWEGYKYGKENNNPFWIGKPSVSLEIEVQNISLPHTEYQPKPMKQEETNDTGQ